jgi:hypothetical protein
LLVTVLVLTGAAAPGFRVAHAQDATEDCEHLENPDHREGCLRNRSERDKSRLEQQSQLPRILPDERNEQPQQPANNERPQQQQPANNERPQQPQQPANNEQPQQPAHIEPQPARIEPQPAHIEPQPARIEPQPARIEPQPARIEPQPRRPPPDFDAIARNACGVVVKPDAGRPVIVVSANRRSSIDAALGSPLPADVEVDVEAIDVDACFSRMGRSDYVMMTPPGRPDQYSVTGGNPKSELSKWLAKSAAQGGRVKLAPGTECADVLASLPLEAAAAWVEVDQGPSRCERDAAGSIRIDSNKFDGYSGVIVLKVERD